MIEEVAKIEEVVNKLINDRREVISFINVTPWWGGNEFGYTFDDDGNVTYPTANGIVGKTRWFMRNIIAQALSRDNFSEVDERYLKELGTLNNKSKITVRVIKERGDVEPHYFTKEEAACAFKRSLKLDKSICHNKDTLCNLGSLSPIDEYLMYFCVPRFNLVHLGQNGPEFYYYNQPARPRSIRIKVEVINNGASKEFFEFFKMSLIFTMKYMGIGRAATRGFGRFVPENQSGQSSLDEELGKLYSLLKPIIKNDEVRPLNLEKISRPCLFNYRNDNFLPIYGQNPIVYLIAIGNATLKVAWKRFEGKPYKDHGYNYHTWTLGLPRGQGRLGYSIKKEEDREKEDKGRRISYITLSPKCDGYTCEEIYLIPFIYEEEEAKKLIHRGKHDREKEVVKGNVRSYVEKALKQIKLMLSGGSDA
ncbi:RAMP superfamily CRISPR-associated protein [Stygiolobus caldivivus]|uniref:RAMP superfamily CRISPR-associated protein n=1 Tax=Stygiolobus caldivivus TaxID=2824673 RepID=UPI001CED9A87|nr:RAMP superfamily CRISPR-associated protein [Stygiolobus caldivivus]